MSRYGTSTTPDRAEVQVRVDGEPVEPLVQRDVVEVDVAEEVGRHGRLSLLVQNWDPDTRTVRHSDDGPFTPGVGIEVLLGYHAELAPVFSGVVVALTTHFPAGGRPVLRVEARSRSILLAHPPRSRRFEDVTDADVVSAVAADYGLGTDAADGPVRAVVVSDRRSDWDLLTERAGRLGWVTYVRDETLVFRPPAPADDPVELEHGLNLTELHLTQDLTQAVASVVAVGWDVDAAEPVDAEAGAAQALDVGARQDHGRAVEDAGWPLRTEELASPAVTAADAAQALAEGRQRTVALGHLHGNGMVVGNPSLRCDTWVSIAGVGERMSGPHYLTAVRHRLSAHGYRTELQVGRPPALVPPSTPARRGGLTTGVVESLEDPAGLNRARVRMPWRDDGGNGVWARVVTADAGDGYGTVLLPDVGQEVLLGCLDGDDATPVVLGALVNGTHPAPVAVDSDDNPVRALVTPEGHRIVLVDGDSAGVTIETAGGNLLHLDEAGSTVSLTHGDSGNAVTLSGDGIELSAAQGDIVLSAPGGAVTIDGLRIEATSSGPSKIESSATFDLKASATLGLTGALVTIN